KVDYSAKCFAPYSMSALADLCSSRSNTGPKAASRLKPVLRYAGSCADLRVAVRSLDGLMNVRKGQPMTSAISRATFRALRRGERGGGGWDLRAMRIRRGGVWRALGRCAGSDSARRCTG